ncbi:hypothetical protein JB92DRAFT_3008425 [Gautieria morchelliformis]|nr:hypothetical protein JB92DRAFT_3008425 [Gautieria morchelliformis]
MISSFSLALPLLAATVSNAYYDHTVVVGGRDLLAYTPSSIKAQVGDTITFQFREKNHTVTQASFESPCSPLSGGFNSGFRPVPPGTQSGLPTYTITVNDTKPIWAYCAQTGPPAHCPQGMVFAANAPDYGNTFDAFRNKAMSLGSSSTSGASSGSASSAAQYSSAGSGATVTKTVTETTTVTATAASCSTAAASSGSPVTHKIVVGGTQDGKPLLAYTPPTIVANVGDFVEFEFREKNHTVTQSPFSNPCTKLETASHGSMVGFDSGFMPVAPNTTSGFPTFKIRVNDTAPIWGYCRQQGPPVHCFQGMVFGINPPTSGPNIFASFQQLAIHSNVTALY